MSLNDITTSLIYLLAVFVLFALGKVVYDKINHRFELRHELLEKDNLAFATTLVGYYLGLIFALGGVIVGPSVGTLVDDLLDLVIYGVVVIVLLNLSGWINDRLILYRFDNEKEIITDQNVGTGAVEGASYLASGLVVFGAISGEGGDLVTAAVFWILGQVVLIVGGLVYQWITPFDLHDEIERDNVAVGVAFAGVLIALGNLVRIGIEGDFVDWRTNLIEFAGVVVFGLVLLPLLRFATDKVLLPGHKLTDELVNQDKPNVGAGLVEAFSYLAASMLIGWVVTSG